MSEQQIIIDAEGGKKLIAGLNWRSLIGAGDVSVEIAEMAREHGYEWGVLDETESGDSVGWVSDRTIKPSAIRKAWAGVLVLAESWDELTVFLARVGGDDALPLYWLACGKRGAEPVADVVCTEDELASAYRMIEEALLDDFKDVSISSLTHITGMASDDLPDALVETDFSRAEQVGFSDLLSQSTWPDYAKIRRLHKSGKTWMVQAGVAGAVLLLAGMGWLGWVKYQQMKELEEARQKQTQGLTPEALRDLNQKRMAEAVQESLRLDTDGIRLPALVISDCNNLRHRLPRKPGGWQLKSLICTDRLGSAVWRRDTRSWATHHDFEQAMIRWYVEVDGIAKPPVVEWVGDKEAKSLHRFDEGFEDGYRKGAKTVDELPSFEDIRVSGMTILEQFNMAEKRGSWKIDEPALVSLSYKSPEYEYMRQGQKEKAVPASKSYKRGKLTIKGRGSIRKALRVASWWPWLRVDRMEVKVNNPSGSDDNWTIEGVFVTQ